MPVSIREVAAHAGVSVATVSNVLNRPEIVAQPTRDRVNASIRQLGFVRNESARQLRAGHSRTIGLVVLDVANPFFTDVARGVEDEASKAGLAVILCNSDDQERKEKRYLELLEEHRVQGVLITPVVGTGSRLARLQRRRHLRWCSSTAGRRPAASARSRSTTCSAATSRSRTCWPRATSTSPTSAGRPASARSPTGARARCARSRGPAAPRTTWRSSTPGRSTSAAGQKAGADVAALPAGSRPTAVFCANDLIALGVLQEMTRNRIRVPEDVSIIGYDDIDFAAAAAVPLTSVRQPRHQLGRTAARLLLDEADGDGAHQHRQVIFEPELVVRQSTQPAS